MIVHTEKVLVVGDADAATSDSLVKDGQHVVHAAAASDGLAKFAADKAITIVVFGAPPVEDIAAFVAKLYGAERGGLVILGQGGPEQRERFKQQEIRLFLTQPWSAGDLLALVRKRRLTMGLANLHDAFLTASMVKVVMDSSSVADDPEAFMISDRGRAERLWVSLLAVLVEAWQSGQMRLVRDHVCSIVDTTDLTALVRKARQSGTFEVRHYMFHRDEREYWDSGRTAVAGHFEYHRDLHEQFSRVLRTAMQELRSGT